MAEKISTVILKVDLECHRCYKKISKTICNLQERDNIHTITFDEKNNTVTISGQFDPHKLCKKLCRKACNVIKDIQIKEKSKETKPTEPAEPKKDKPKETKPAESAEPKKDKPKDGKPAEAAEPKKDKPKDAKPAEPKKDKEKEKANDAKQDQPKKDKPKDPEAKKDKSDPPAPGLTKFELVSVDQETKFVYQPVWAGPGCGCGPRPWYEGSYGDNGCWCGRGNGWVPEGPPAVVYGTPAYGGYKPSTLFCEEDPQSSCTIM